MINTKIIFKTRKKIYTIAANIQNIFISICYKQNPSSFYILAETFNKMNQSNRSYTLI